MKKEELEIRILPMSKNEFEGKSQLDVQKEFFKNELLNRDGVFHYFEKGIKTAYGSLILFQYDNDIIASAILKGIENYSSPVDGKYNNAYVFDNDSIKVFEPIKVSDLQKIIKNFKSFNQAATKIDYIYIDQINQLIEEKRKLWKDDSIKENNTNSDKEGNVIWGIQRKIERNKKARRECINHYGTVCQVCGFDFEKVYGEIGKGFIHVHHIEKLASKTGEHVVDPIKDLITVCPNCHAMLHSNSDGEEITVDRLKKIIEENK
jgi:5-methylcytosine-specific restriction protein A